MIKSKKVFISALFFYILIAPFFYHPDLKTIFFQSQFLGKGVVDIYSFLLNDANASVLGPFTYPPLSYFLMGILFYPVKLLAGGGFVNWLSMGSDAVNVEGLFRYVFSMKLVPISFLFLSGFFLSKLFKSKKKTKSLLLFWFFNPISIYAVGMMGQIDSIAVFLCVLSLYFLKEKKRTISSLFLGLGAAVKTFPVLLVPFVAKSKNNKTRSFIKNITIGLIGYFIFTAFFINNPSFIESTFLSGLSQRIFTARIDLGFGESIFLIPLVIIALFLYFYNKTDDGFEFFSKYAFLVISIVVVGSHFHPQWGLWFVPFLAVNLFDDYGFYKKDLVLPLILLVSGYFGTIFLIDDKFLTWGLISSLDSGILFLPSLSGFIERFYDPFLIQSIFHTLMAASVGFIGYKLTYEKD